MFRTNFTGDCFISIFYTFSFFTHLHQLILSLYTTEKVNLQSEKSGKASGKNWDGAQKSWKASRKFEPHPSTLFFPKFLYKLGDIL